MNMHRCDEARVMYLHTRYLFSDHNPPPFLMGCFAISDKIELGFD
jgi:hypothetical protein